MKKTTITMTLLASMGSVQAASFDLAGTFQMRDPGGALIHNDTTLIGEMHLDMGAGTGTAMVVSSMPFFGFMWTAHDFTLQMTSSNALVADLLWDWTGGLDVPMHFDMAIVMSSGAIGIETIDGDGDGIIGSSMDSGPFPGFNAAINLYPIPVPAAVWLFGSGLLGLVGIAKRKKT